MRKMMVAACAAGMLAIAPAGAVSFSAAYVFGDSLSDNGNAADAIGITLPTPPYANNSFTNGTVAVQVMAQRFGLDATAALYPPGTDPTNANFATGGTNYSFAGATSGSMLGQGQPGANLANQVTYYLGKSRLVADPDALYTVFIGGNDVRRAAETGNSAYVTEGIATEIAAIQQLVRFGARHLLVVNVPNIGGIPEYALENPAKAGDATTLTQTYNNGLARALRDTFPATPARIYQFDLYSFNETLIANAASLGITNTVDPCYTGYPVTRPAPITTSAACGSTDGGRTQAENIDQFYFWDNHHPTAKVHAALGNALADFVEVSEAPEPASWAMMIAGFGLVGCAMRRRRITIHFA